MALRSLNLLEMFFHKQTIAGVISNKSNPGEIDHDPQKYYLPLWNFYGDSSVYKWHRGVHFCNPAVCSKTLECTPGTQAAHRWLHIAPFCGLGATYRNFGPSHDTKVKLRTDVLSLTHRPLKSRAYNSPLGLWKSGYTFSFHLFSSKITHVLLLDINRIWIL